MTCKNNLRTIPRVSSPEDRRKARVEICTCYRCLREKKNNVRFFILLLIACLTFWAFIIFLICRNFYE
jgi:hypothetical protein